MTAPTVRRHRPGAPFGGGDATPPIESSQLSHEDFEKLAAAAPENVQVELVNGRVRTEDPLSVEDFEEWERRAPEGVRLEYINGEVGFKPMSDGNHKEILLWLTLQITKHRPDLGFYRESGLKTETYRKGRARTDGAVARRGLFKGHGEWSTADGVLMTVGVTSHDSDSNDRNRIYKPVGYAVADIPVYLLIDRDNHTLVVYSAPEGGRYRKVTAYPWGTDVALPDPLGFTLDTSELQDYAD